MEENFLKLYIMELNCIQLFLPGPPNKILLSLRATQVNKNFVKLYLPLSLSPSDKFADDTKSRLADTPDGYATIHRDLDRLEIQAHRNLIESDKRKCSLAPEEE